MAETQKQRLDKLIRQGMLPARQLPILHRALANVKMGKILTPYEREALSKLLDKMMGFQFGDDITYNRARLHTQKTKYQTEERQVAKEEEDVKIFDGTKDEEEAKRDKKVKKNGKSKLTKAEKDRDEDEKYREESNEKSRQNESVKPDLGEGLLADLDAEGLRARASRKAKRLGRVSKEKKMKMISSRLRKEKEKSESVEARDDILKFNETYKKNLEDGLKTYGVDNVRDIPDGKKKDFFSTVDEGSHAAAARPADKDEGDTKKKPAQGGSNVNPEITDGPKQTQPSVKEQYEEMKKAIKEGTYSKKQLKMAKGIAFDKRYKGGNMTGAAKQMEKIKKGLSDHPESLKHLRTANEEIEQPLEEGKLKDFALGHGYFDDSGEGKRKRADKNWLSKQAGSKKTIPYPKKKVKEEAELEEGGIGGSVKLKDAGKVAKAMEKSMGLKVKSKKSEVFRNKDGKITGYGGKTEYTREETEELDREKQPNEKVRALHNTVRDVLSPDPLVIDPNYELQKETDKLYNQDNPVVKEGAKEDALRDIKQDSGKGMAPVKKDRPEGTSKYNSQIDRGPEHIVPQMRKAVSLGDKHDGVKFQDGKTHKVKAKHAQRFLDKHDSMKPQDKLALSKHAHASHDNFKTHT